MAEMDHDKWACAHHESGHGCASVLLFREVGSFPAVRYLEITEYEPGRWSGHCVNSDIFKLKWPQLHDAMEAKIVIFMSGGIAEAVSRGERRRHHVLKFAQDHCGMTTDMMRANAVGCDLSRLIGCYNEQRLVDRTLMLLVRHWDAVEAVARALARQRRLEGDEVEALIVDGGFSKNR